jgi:hypothetical protein
VGTCFYTRVVENDPRLILFCYFYNALTSHSPGPGFCARPSPSFIYTYHKLRKRNNGLSILDTPTTQFDHDATRAIQEGPGSLLMDRRKMWRCVTTADFLIYRLLWKINARISLSTVHEVLASDPWSVDDIAQPEATHNTVRHSPPGTFRTYWMLVVSRVIEWILLASPIDKSCVYSPHTQRHKSGGRPDPLRVGGPRAPHTALAPGCFHTKRSYFEGLRVLLIESLNTGPPTTSLREIGAHSRDARG